MHFFELSRTIWYLSSLSGIHIPQSLFEMLATLSRSQDIKAHHKMLISSLIFEAFYEESIHKVSALTKDDGVCIPKRAPINSGHNFLGFELGVSWAFPCVQSLQFPWQLQSYDLFLAIERPSWFLLPSSLAKKVCYLNCYYQPGASCKWIAIS